MKHLSAIAFDDGFDTLHFSTFDAPRYRTDLPGHRHPELAIVIPTYNERANVAAMVEKLDLALRGRRWEAIFVDDDSPDGTSDAVREIATSDSRIRILHRIGRRGLSSACIEGICAAIAPCVAVIDGDLQHDERLLAGMLDALQADTTLDIVIGSRFVEGGGTGSWASDRVAKSQLATRLCRHVLKDDLADPMSGFFMTRTALVRALAPNLSGIGFKILLDIMTAAPRPLAFRELPYVFRNREAGESKLDHVVALDFLVALYDRACGRICPAQSVLFLAVAACIACAQLCIGATLSAAGLSAAAAALAGLAGGILAHFAIEQVFTPSGKRARDWRTGLDQLGRFLAVIAPGAVAATATSLWLARYGLAAACLGSGVYALWTQMRARSFLWSRY